MPEPTFDPATGVNVPIQLPKELADLLAQPICLDIALPKPASAKLTLPLGGSISAVTDVTKAIPDSCAVNFSLLLQLGPILAPMKCMLAVLQLIGPLIEIVKGLPFPPAEAIKKFIEAVQPVLDCIAQIAIGLPLFIRDIICLIIKLLGCLIDQLRSIMELLNGLAIRIEGAAGNAQHLAQLECEMENAQCAAQGAMQGFEPIVVILELIGPMVEQVSGQSIEIPAFAAPEDLEGMQEVIDGMTAFQQALQGVADILGGCP
jgi:hypothetical protein